MVGLSEGVYGGRIFSVACRNARAVQIRGSGGLCASNDFCWRRSFSHFHLGSRGTVYHPVFPVTVSMCDSRYAADQGYFRRKVFSRGVDGKTELRNAGFGDLSVCYHVHRICCILF